MDDDAKHELKMLRIIVMIFGLALLMVILALQARAHEAPSGWTYPSECCSSTDCQPMKGVRRGKDGWVLPNGQEIPIGSPRQSGDDEWHWCLDGEGHIRVADGKPCVYKPTETF